jgi:hypothetical protein
MITKNDNRYTSDVTQLTNENKFAIKYNSICDSGAQKLGTTN